MGPGFDRESNDDAGLRLGLRNHQSGSFASFLCGVFTQFKTAQNISLANADMYDIVTA
jgi:hypothetical protein